MKNRKFFPISYSVQPFTDDRFLKLRVKLMHLGLNLNDTNFNRMAAEDAEPSLSNTPLLAFVKKQDGSAKADFGGHEIEFKVTQNGIESVYLGRPIGLFPETNNHTFEVDDSGKMFVWADAYVWKDYANEALAIIEDAGKKKVSMEIKADEVAWNESAGYWDVIKYRYTGVALLGDEVQEAMVGAAAEIMTYSANQGFMDIIEGYKTDLDSILFSMENEEADEPEADEPEVDKPIVDEPIIDEPEVNEPIVDEPETDHSAGDPIVDEPIVDQPIVDEPEAEKNEEFDKNDELNEGETTTKGEGAEEFSVEDYIAQIESLKEENAALAAEVAVFKAEQLEKENEIKLQEKQELIKEFSDLEELETFEALKTRIEEFSREELELQLFALRGKNSSKKQEQKLEFSFIGNYSTKSNNEPEWAEIVKNYKEEV